jgi:hypothetical protein
MRGNGSASAFVLVLLLAAAGLALLAAPAGAQATRHHIQLGLGFQKYLSDDLKDEADDVDFTNAALGIVAYRFSITPSFDLVFESRATNTTKKMTGPDLKLTNYFAGPGVRFTTPPDKVRYYGQATFLAVTERLAWEDEGTEISHSETDVGFGLVAGADIRASRLLSVPIEVGFLYGKPADDLSAINVSAGLTFNFGHLR